MMEVSELIKRLDLSQETRLSLQNALTESEENTIKVFQQIADGDKKHRQIYASKRSIQKMRRLKWGEEIHLLLQKFLNEGKCLQTAKKLAGKEFVRNHKTTENEAGQPGCTRPAIHRYLEEYRSQLT